MPYKIAGLALIAVLIAVPAVWFIPLAAQHKSAAILSQYLGSTALIAMGISQVMATRIRGVETIFGGLDRVYVLHKWLGILAVAAVLLHDTIGAEVDRQANQSGLGDFGEGLGEQSLNLLLVLTAITLAIFIPYRLWRYTHKLMGLAFALGAAHFLLLTKPFANTDPLGLYVGAFCVLGLVAYAYTLLPLAALKRARGYTISGVENSNGALIIDAAPAGKPLRHHAGQFAILRLTEGPTELHPFTISRAPDPSGTLRFSIKPMGDYTRALARHAKPGAGLSVTGPYGHFRPNSGKRPKLWIAAGIGITPFVAAAADRTNSDADTHLIYCARDAATAPHRDDLETAARDANFTLKMHYSATAGRLKAARIVEALPHPLARYDVYFCGPSAMKTSLRAELVTRGLKRRRFHDEAFEFRTGLPLGPLTRIARPLVDRGVDWARARFAR